MNTVAIRRLLARACLPAVLVLLNACAAQPLHFHTLLGTQQPARSRQAADLAGDRGGDLAIELQRVRVPAQVDHPELVLRAGDGRLLRIEDRRWSAPLPDEVRAALAAALSSQLQVREVSAVVAPGTLPVYRVAVDLQRFDAQLDRAVRVEAVWSLRRLASGQESRVWTCASSSERVAGTGYDALIAAAQQALLDIAAQMAMLISAAQQDAAQAACRS